MQQVAGILIALATFLALGCGEEAPTAEPDTRPPDFILPDLEGNDFQLSSTQGKVVLLTFFTTTCPTCAQEVQYLKAMHEEYGDDGLEIVAVVVEAASTETVQSYVDAFEIPYTVLVDDGVVSLHGYGVTRVPTNYLINRDPELLGPYGALSPQQFDVLVRTWL